MTNLDDAPEGVDIRQLAPDKLVPFPNACFETTHATFGRFLPEALAKGAYKVAPPPLIVNRKGLDGVQEAIDIMRVVSEKGQEGVKEAIECVNDGMIKQKTSLIKVVVERP